MALNRVLNFDHLPGANLLTGMSSTGYLATPQLQQWLDLVGAGGTPYVYVYQYLAASITIDSAGWLAFTCNGNTMNALEIPVAMFLNLPSGKASWVGFRFKVTGTMPAAGGVLMSSQTQNGTGSTTHLSYAMLASWGVVAGQECFLEFQYQQGATTTTVNVYLNGTFKKTLSVENGNLVYFWFGAAQGAMPGTCVANYRDIYFSDEDGLGNWDSARIGAIRTTGLPVKTVSAPNYTVNDPGNTGLTDYKAILNNAPSAGTPSITPNIANAASLDPLGVTFDTASIPAGQLMAVQFQAAQQNASSASGTITPAYTNGTQQIVLPAVTTADTIARFTRQLGLVKTAPDGSALTVAKLAAATLSLKPSTA